MKLNNQRNMMIVIARFIIKLKFQKSTSSKKKIQNKPKIIKKLFKKCKSNQKMQKITAGKNKNSKLTAHMNMNESLTIPQRKKISQESIREFKIEIDHEIAKCLDTLDRQGLKFLKQTLKTSALFNSQSIEIEDKYDHRIHENIKQITFPVQILQTSKTKDKKSQQKNQQTKKVLIKNKEPKKQYQNKTRSNSSVAINSKQALSQTFKQQTPAKNLTIKNLKSQEQTHPAPIQKTTKKESSQIKQKTNIPPTKKTVIENKKTKQRIGLGERLNKKMYQLNIKKVGMGKEMLTASKLKIAPQGKLQSSKEPQQAIEEEIAESIQNQFVNEAYGQSSQQVSQSVIRSNIGQFREVTVPSMKLSEKINPLKSFRKQRLQESESIFLQSKIEEKKPELQKKQVKQIQKLSASIQVDDGDFYLRSLSNVQDRTKSAEMSLIVEKINKLSPEKFLEIQKYLDMIENKSMQSKKQSNEQEKAQIINCPISLGIVLNNSESRTQAQKNSIKYLNGNNSIKQLSGSNSVKQLSGNSIQKSEQTPQKLSDIVLSFMKEDTIKSKQKNFVMIAKNQSRKAIKQKKQKASTIYGVNSRCQSRSRIKVEVDSLKTQKSGPQQKASITDKREFIANVHTNNQAISDSQPFEPQKIILQCEKPLKMEKIDYVDSQKKSNQKNMNEISLQSEKSCIQPSIKDQSKSIKDQSKYSQTKIISPQYKLINHKIQTKQILTNTQSHRKVQSSSNVQHTQVKMLNISNKRIPITKKVQNQNKVQIKFKILSNRGHPSLYGLTGIELFTTQNKRVILTQNELSQNQTSIPKLLYLFNGEHYLQTQDHIYQSPVKKDQIIIELDKQNEKIGGILIFNFNKSSLESQKQVNQMEIYHNDSIIWKGVIRAGSYNQNVDYATQIKLVPNFEFKNCSEEKNQQLKHSVYQNSQIWISDQYSNNPIYLQEKKYQQPQKWLYKSQNRRIQGKSPNREDLKISLPSQLKKQSLDKVQGTKPYRLNQIKKQISDGDQYKNNKEASKPNILPKKELLITKQRVYDQFDTMLKGLEQNINREKSKSKFMPSEIIAEENNKFKKQFKNKEPAKKSIFQIQKQKNPEKTQNIYNQIDDFMKDSMFNQKPSHSFIPKVKTQIDAQNTLQLKEQIDNYTNKIKQNNLQKNNHDINIDDFLGQLQDVMKNKGSLTKKGKQSKKDIQIPLLPQGSAVQLQILENWGHQAYVGLQAIQFFDKDGKAFNPDKIECDKNPHNVDLLKNFNNKNIMNRDQKIQTKLGYQKGSSTILTFKFESQKIFSLIRIWNYNGHRVHSNVGVKNLTIKINGKDIFNGELRKNQATSETFHNHFEPLLFTKDPIIIKKIKQNDWLTQLRNKNKQDKAMFKSTLINLHRPKTKNSEQKDIVNQNTQKIVEAKVKQIKVSKRNCWEYEPPEMPEGNILIFILHETWGDRNFIGLNGISIFDSQGKIINRSQISKIKAFPHSTGQNNDKRVVQNLINGKNLSSQDSNIWLSTFQSDLQKLQSGQPNTIIIQLQRPIKISGLNIYNYSKTPERGVREIQIQVNRYVAFRGYLKIFNEGCTQNCFHTTINFTKNLQLLAKMNFEGYNEDSIEQNVFYVNERKIVNI